MTSVSNSRGQAATSAASCSEWRQQRVSRRISRQDAPAAEGAPPPGMYLRTGVAWEGRSGQRRGRAGWGGALQVFRCHAESNIPTGTMLSPLSTYNTCNLG